MAKNAVTTGNGRGDHAPQHRHDRPDGVGKTEIARRLAQLVEAPLIKVEATKFTEVGYVGRDVESMIRDLLEAAIKMIRDSDARNVAARAEDAARDRVVSLLLGEAIGEPASEEDPPATQQRPNRTTPTTASGRRCARNSMKALRRP